MDSKTSSIYKIVVAGLGLFREKGFDATSIREIASAAGVSLGMVNHYFGSKEFLGLQCLQVLSSYTRTQLEGTLSFEEKPILTDLVTVRLLYRYLTEYGYEQFYFDSLKNDFFFKYLSEWPTRIIRLLSQHYPIEATDDEIMLYSRYLPYMMEKTLVLKKEEGLFESIPKERIPYMIVLTALDHFIPESAVAEQDAESILLAEKMMDGLEEEIPESFLMGFVEQYIERLESTNASQKENWIRQMNVRY